jgi:biotin carboxyl carrier protein
MEQFGVGDMEQFAIPRPADPARSRIVLIGTPAHRHPDERLPDVPAVANNVADLHAVFTDPDLGGFDARHCLALSGTGLNRLGEALTTAADQAEDLLLIYYAGHRLLDRRGQLHLALAGTHPDRLAFTALAYETLRSVCLDSTARSRVVILDSCFSGRAIGETLADPGQQVLGQLEVAGTYTLTSAPANRSALILPGERHTAFTGRLLDLLRAGDPDAGPVLSMGGIYRWLRSRLRADGLPEPQQRGTATADLLGLVRNRRPAAPAPVPLPEGIRDGLDSRYPNIRLGAVQELAPWLTDADAGRVLTAREVLQQVADHDNPTVARAAREVLAAVVDAAESSRDIRDQTFAEIGREMLTLLTPISANSDARGSDTVPDEGPKIPVHLPALGEEVTEGTVTRWLKQEGDWVEEDEPLLEVATDKVDTELPAPVAGWLTSIAVAEDETVPIGHVLAVITQSPQREKRRFPNLPKAR